MGDDTHECPKRGCTRRVPSNQLACRSHWYSVSKATRDRVWQTYMADDDQAHMVAMAQAIEEMNESDHA